MGPAEALAGVAIRHAPHTWAGYERLVRVVVDQVWPVNVVLLGVCTPRQLAIGQMATGSFSIVPMTSAGRGSLRVGIQPRRRKRLPMLPSTGR